MIPDLAPVLAAVTFYVGLLFLLAVWVERRAARGRNLADNALVYTLAQAVYCTTWTYYGSVGFAVSYGLLFLAVYLGPTLAFIFSGFILRKLVRIKARFSITSIADFVSARYGKSQTVGALATVIVVMGLVPYLSLQLKTMITTAAIMAGPGRLHYPEVGIVFGPVMVVLMVVFTIVFGIRRLRPTERHPGMMVALVAECIIKLVGFLAAGAFVTFHLFHGFGDLLHRADALPTNFAAAGRGISPPPGTWLAHIVLSASASLFLPRQFHVAVVENYNEEHIRTAQWLFPLYLFLICIFVIPMAAGGIAFGFSPAAADTFVLALPVAGGQPWLSWLVFLGGFSAGTGMVMVETMTLSTMISNHLLLPVVGRVAALQFLRSYIKPFRWVTAAAIIGAAFAYERAFGWRYEIVRTGLISFAAALQFAPAILLGLHWKRASKTGALLGLSVGFAIWGYTLIVPVLIREGFLPMSLLDRGAFGISLLRPEALFGIEGLDSVVHGALWSASFNLGLLVLGSIIWPASADELREAETMIGILSPETESYHGARRPALIDTGWKRSHVLALLSAYFGPAAAGAMTAEAFQASGLAEAGKASVLELAQVEAEVERLLASSIGVAASHAAIQRASLFSAEEARELSHAYAEILTNLRVSPAELRRKVDYHRERERLLAKEAETLRAFEDASRRLGSSLEYEATARTAVGIPVPWLVPAALLYVAEQFSDGMPTHLLLSHVDSDKERRTNQVLSASQLDLRTLPHLSRAMSSGQVELAAPDAPSAWPPPISELEFSRSLTLPLRTRSTLGTITLFADDASPLRYPDDLALAQELAFRCATALDNASLFHKTEEAVRVRDEFLAVASHELRTPLTPLMLQVQNARRALAQGHLVAMPEKRLDKLLGRSEAQVTRLSRLVDSLLDVSRITRGHLRLVTECEGLSSIVGDVVALLREQLRGAGCEVTVDLAPGLSGRWDRLRLEQVVMNLLTNAMKYAPGKPVEVRTSGEGSCAKLVVRDHGPGISKEDQERIFRPFERAVSYVEVSGFGLGLYIARQIVDAHGGRITLDSEPGSGATFTVELPLESCA